MSGGANPRAAQAPAIVEIDATRGGLALLRRFHDEAYVAQFPDPDERESLGQMARYLRLKDRGWYGANNYHVLVALDGDAPVGGVVLDYLALPVAGMVEFLFVLPAMRGTGLGRRLLDAGLQCLRADARAQGARLVAIAAEMNDPFRRPAKPDNMDPFVRAAMWGRWGFDKLLCPYAQPALSAEQDSVDYLTLIVRPMRPAARSGRRSVAAAWVRTLVAEYMRWAMRIRAPERSAEYQRLDAYLDTCPGANPRVPLLPLRASIGQDDRHPFDTHEIDAQSPAFEAVVRLARRAIPVPGHAAAAGVYRDAMRDARSGGPAYHLWSITVPCGASVDGMASFFSLASAGFGGYVVLDTALRGRGLLAALLARMEAAMMADGSGAGQRAPGWFIECADDSAPVFLRRGFAVVPVDYRPPSIDSASPAVETPLHLLYKPFGAAYLPLELPLELLRRSLREILRHVYGIEAPARHPSYRRAAARLAADAQGRIRLRDAL